MKHYVYKISNIIEDKHYIGVRSSRNPIKDLGIKYFSSSTDGDFMKEQQEFPERFEYKILEVFSTRNLAVAKEIELHDLYDVAVNESFYNRAKQTSSGFCRLGTTFNHTEETKEKLSLAKLGEKHPLWGKSPSDETRKKQSESRAGEKHFMWGKKHSQETRNKISETLTGRTLSEETKRKIGAASKGKIVLSETRAKMSAWQKGKPKSEEQRRKMSETVKAKAIASAHRFIIHDSENNLVHDEVIVSFKDFCTLHNYPNVYFGNSYRNNDLVKTGKYKGWRVEKFKI